MASIEPDAQQGGSGHEGGHHEAVVHEDHGAPATQAKVLSEFMLMKAVDKPVELGAHAVLKQAQWRVDESRQNPGLGQFAEMLVPCEIESPQKIRDSPFERLAKRLGETVVDAQLVGKRRKQWRKTQQEHGQVVPAGPEPQDSSKIEDDDTDEDGHGDDGRLGEFRKKLHLQFEDRQEQPPGKQGYQQGLSRREIHEQKRRYRQPCGQRTVCEMIGRPVHSPLPLVAWRNRESAEAIPWRADDPNRG